MVLARFLCNFHNDVFVEILIRDLDFMHDTRFLDSISQLEKFEVVGNWFSMPNLSK